jgi:hypothetical protein
MNEFPEENPQGEDSGTGEPQMPTQVSRSRRYAAACLLLLVLGTAACFHRVLLHPDKTFWSLDIPAAHSEYKLVQWRSFAEWGRFPLWDPTIFCGKSIVGDSLPAVLNPPQWLFWLTPSPTLFGYILWFYVTVAACGMFLFARKKGCDPYGAMLAAMIFAVGGRTAAHLFAGHVEVLATMLCLPWIMLAAEAVLEKPSILRAGLLGAVLAIASTCGSVQIIYWDVLFVSAYAALRLVAGLPSRGWSATLRAALAFAAGLLCYLVLAAPWWFPIVRQTLLLSARARGTDLHFAATDSPQYVDLLRLVWPFHGADPPALTQIGKDAQVFLENVFYAGAVPLAVLLSACLAPKKVRGLVLILAGCAVVAYLRTMGGGGVSSADAPQMGCFYEKMLYIGIVPLALFLPACLLPGKNRVLVMILAVLGVVVTLLGMGDHGPLLAPAVRFVPGYVLFRCPGRLFFYTAFLAALIVGLFVSERGTLTRKWAVLAVSAVLFIVAVVGAFLQWRAVGAAWPVRAWLPIALLAVFVPVTLLWAHGILSDNTWKTAALLLVCCDLFVVLDGHMMVVNAKYAIQPTRVGEYLAGQKRYGEFRLLAPEEIMNQTSAAKYGLEIVAGFHPGISGRYFDLYKAIWKSDASQTIPLQEHSPREIAHPALLDLMNVAYLAVGQNEPGMEGDAATEITAYDNGPAIKVFRRDSALPRVCIVPDAVLPAPGESMLDAVSAMDPKAGCLVVDRPFQGGDAFRPLPYERHSPSDLTVRFTSEKGGVVLISQAWHPDWQATDHGGPIEVRRVNYDFVGLCVGPGDHEIRVWYRPWDFYLGCCVAAAAWAVLALAGARAAWRWRRPAAAS